MHLSRAIVPAVIMEFTEHEEEREARQLGGFAQKERQAQRPKGYLKVRIMVGLNTGFMAYTVLYTHETPFS